MFADRMTIDTSCECDRIAIGHTHTHTHTYNRQCVGIVLRTSHIGNVMV